MEPPAAAGLSLPLTDSIGVFLPRWTETCGNTFGRSAKSLAAEPGLNDHSLCLCSIMRPLAAAPCPSAAPDQGLVALERSCESQSRERDSRAFNIFLATSMLRPPKMRQADYTLHFLAD